MDIAQQKAPQGAAESPQPERNALPRAAGDAESSAAAAQLAQVEPQTPVPAPDAGLDAGAPTELSGEGGELGERELGEIAPGDTALSDFLRDAAPEPLDLTEIVDQPATQAGPPRVSPREGRPIETAADVPAPDSGGASFYRDDFGALNAELELTEESILVDSPNPVFVEQFGEPLVLSSLAAPPLTVPAMDVPAPQLAPLPAGPDSDPDALISRQIAAGVLDDEEDEEPAGQNLAGTPAAEALDGGAGDDTLNGGTGDDTLTGGDGQDIFSFSVVDGGDDVLTDFESGSGGDIVRLTDVTDADGDGTVDLGDLDAGAGNSVSGPGVPLVLGFAGGASLTLSGVDGTGIGSFGDLATSNVNVDVA